jgi:cytochrome b561
MAKTAANPGYTGTAKILHWTILVLLIIQFIVAWTMPDIRRDTPPDTLINVHFSVGILILSVAIVRLGWRLTHPEPPPLDGLPPWQVQSARIMHWLLYLLLFVLPILGWMAASWRGFPVIMFGLELPKLLATRAAGFRWVGGARTAGDLWDADAGRAARGGRALSLFRSPRPRAAAHAAGKITQGSSSVSQ